jgi:hypothetical protein
MSVIAGRGVRLRHLRRAAPKVNYPRARGKGQPAFRVAGIVRLNANEDSVVDLMMSAFNALTRADAKGYAEGQSPTAWADRFDKRIKKIIPILIRAATEGGNKGFTDAAAALQRTPSTQGTWQVQKVDIQLTEPGPNPATRSVSFNSTNPLYGEYARDRAAYLVQEINQNTLLGVREAVSNAFTQQITWGETATTIENLLSAGAATDFATDTAYMVRGLDQAWATAVQRRTFESIKAGERSGLTPTKAVDRAKKIGLEYGNQLRQKRAVLIARTEIMTAANRGRAIGMQQLADEGLFNPATAGKRWLTAAIDVCQICVNLADVVVEYVGTFDTAGVDFPPAHPNCRCTWVLEPNFVTPL